MGAREHPGRLAFGLIALSLVAYQPEVRSAPPVRQRIASRPAPDPEARVHQRLIIKLRDADASADAALRKRSAQVEIGDIAGRARPAIEGLGTVPLSLLGSIRPGLHVAHAGHRLKRTEMQQLIRQLREDPRVEYAEIDEFIYPQYLPDDPGIASQWSLWPPAPGVEGAASLPGAWDSAYGQGIVVAVLDTGMRLHRDLAGNLLPGYDFVSDPVIANDGNGRDADPSDPGDWISVADRKQAPFASCDTRASSWHGTSMAGIIAAVSDNGIDIAGIAPRARILPVRVFGKCGGHVSDVIAGILWSVGAEPPYSADASAPPVNPNPARVINLSMAAEGSCGHAFQEAIDLARSRGAVVVAAAGNHASDDAAAGLGQPANCRGVIAVTAHTRRGDLAFYAKSHADVTLGAPGGGTGNKSLADDGDWIVTLSNSGATDPVSDELGYMAGTSVAAAHVSGVVALLLGLQPGWNPDQLGLALTRSARAYPQDSDCFGSGLCGAGMLDASAALRWQEANPAPGMPAEDTGPSDGGGGAAGWPELLLLLSATLLARSRRCQPHDQRSAQAARQPRSM